MAAYSEVLGGLDDGLGVLGRLWQVLVTCSEESGANMREQSC